MYSITHHLWIFSYRLSLLLCFTGMLTVHAQTSSNTDRYRNMLNKYCVACHNETLKTANLMLDRANIQNISEDPALWEKVVTKLTLRAMPQVGFPSRPSADE